MVQMTSCNEGGFEKFSFERKNLSLALLCRYIETTDLILPRLDPAIFSVTKDPFIVYCQIFLRFWGCALHLFSGFMDRPLFEGGSLLF
jgi:hypothetical protein